MDKRGDIGSIVREQSMTTMITIIRYYSESNTRKWRIRDEIAGRVVGLILQQLN